MSALSEYRLAMEQTSAGLFQALRGFLQAFWNLEQTLGGLVQTSQGPEQTLGGLLETSRDLEPARGGRVQTSADLLQTSPGGDYEVGFGQLKQVQVRHAL